MVFGVRYPPTILSWSQEEEEGNTGKVSDSPLSLFPCLEVLVESLEDGDWDGAHSVRCRVVLRVCCKLPYQAKVELSQNFVPEFVVSHG